MSYHFDLSLFILLYWDFLMCFPSLISVSFTEVKFIWVSLSSIWLTLVFPISLFSISVDFVSVNFLHLFPFLPSLFLLSLAINLLEPYLGIIFTFVNIFLNLFPTISTQICTFSEIIFISWTSFKEKFLNSILSILDNLEQ